MGYVLATSRTAVRWPPEAADARSSSDLICAKSNGGSFGHVAGSGGWPFSGTGESWLRKRPIHDPALDLNTGDNFAVRGHGGTVASLSFSPDGQWLVSRVRTVCQTLACHFRPEGNALIGHGSFVEEIALSPDGLRLAQ